MYVVTLFCDANADCAPLASGEAVSSRARGFLMTDSTCTTNLEGKGAPVLTGCWATFLRATSVLAMRVGETGRRLLWGMARSSS